MAVEAWNDQQKHRSLERAQEVMRLRIDRGLSFRQIGEEVGITHTTARRLWYKAIGFATEELTEEAKHAVTVEMLRLDKLWETNFNTAQNSNDPDERMAATDRCLRISEQRRKLLGLDAPQQVEVSGPDGGPIVFAEIQTLSDDELDNELAGFFQPGYMEGAADGFKAGQEAAKKKAKPKRKAKPKANSKTTPKEPKELEKDQPPATGGQGQARTGSVAVVVAPVSQGRART